MISDHAAEPAADCAAVLGRLYAFLDGECPEVEADEIRSHLDACDRCVEDADAALALKSLVRRCCATASAPETLRARILTTYSAGGFTSVRYAEVTRLAPPAQ